MKNFLSYLGNVRAELRHVVWPRPRTAALHTLAILALSAFAAVFIGLLDYGFTNVVGQILSR